jgi:hypothetical protein
MDSHSTASAAPKRPPMRPTALYADTPAVDWKAAIGGGLIAGLVFVMLEMLLVWLVHGQSPWGPPRMIAAMALGQEVLPPPADFSAKAVAVAMAIHLPLSAFYGVAIGALVRRLPLGIALAMGLVVGLGLYGLNFHLIAPATFPWFVDAQNWVSAFSHAIFGMVAAAAYVALRREA